MTHSAMHKKNLKYLFRVMCKQSFVSKIDFDFFSRIQDIKWIIEQKGMQPYLAVTKLSN